jgi:hypothetical protein
MADKKISALTGATTPLAGTEVLPIVQSGSTVKVSVANLTDGRAVTATSLAATDFVNATNSVKAGSGSNETILQPKSILFYNTGAGDALIRSADDSSTFTSIALNKTQVKLYTSNTERVNIGSTGDITASTGNLVIGTAGKGITNSTGSVALNFSTVGTALTGGAQSVLTGSFNNVGTAQTVTPDDTRGGTIVITAIQPGIGSTTYTLPFVKRGGTVAIGTPSKAILTADPISTVAASGGGIVITPVAANTFITYAIYYTPLGA